MDSAIETTNQICGICEGILARSGPFLKETIYQDLLIHELNKLNIDNTREMVFNYTFKDSENINMVICNNQFLRSDIELIQQRGILELKSSSASTKEEQIWQLRNYLEHRDDRDWGIVINFISKFGARTAPKIQCDLLYKADTHYNLTTNNVNHNIRQYHTFSIESEPYADKNKIFIESFVEDES